MRSIARETSGRPESGSDVLAKRLGHTPFALSVTDVRHPAVTSTGEEHMSDLTEMTSSVGTIAEPLEHAAADLLASLVEAARSAGDARRATLRYALERALATLGSSSPTDAPPRDGLARWQTKRLDAYIQDHIGSCLKVRGACCPGPVEQRPLQPHVQTHFSRDAYGVSHAAARSLRPGKDAYERPLPRANRFGLRILRSVALQPSISTHRSAKARGNGGETFVRSKRCRTPAAISMTTIRSVRVITRTC